MFDLSPVQQQVIAALVSPFGLILLVQAYRLLAARLSFSINRAHIRIFLGAVALGLAWAWSNVVLPPLPVCSALETCILDGVGFISALVAIGTTLYGSAHYIYELLMRPIFDRLGWQPNE